MVVRKIVNINEDLCTGCGNCIPKCAEGALAIVNGKARIVKDVYCDGLGACLGHCPQGAITVIEREAENFDEKAVDAHLSKVQVKKDEKPARPQWPVQLNLVPIEAPFYEDADLLVVADCVPVAYAALHEVLMPGRRIVIGCPKFDDARAYAQKLGEILKRNKVASVTIAHMEVPCCSGLKWAVDKAIEASGKKIPVKRYEVTIGGEVNEL
jgi:NAD-dependent dihydropyrimidine dehydrogenase PreA subunit